MFSEKSLCGKEIVSEEASSGEILLPINQHEAKKVVRKLRSEFRGWLQRRRGEKLNKEEFLEIVSRAIHEHWGEYPPPEEEKRAWSLVMSEWYKMRHPQRKLKFPPPRKRDYVG